MANASTGPITAPVVSSARCTPKARPRSAGLEAAAIMASRGAVRRPLPTRSTATTAATAARPVLTSSAARAAHEVA